MIVPYDPVSMQFLFGFLSLLLKLGLVRFGKSQKIYLLCSNISNSKKVENEQKIA